MSKKDEALKLALDYLLSKQIGAHIIASLREALAEHMSELEELKLAYAECSRQRNELLNKLKSQAQQESVGYVAENGVVDWNVCAPPVLTDLYTSPPQRKPLTDEQTKLLWHKARLCIGPRWMVFKRLVEAAHGIKENT